MSSLTSKNKTEATRVKIDLKVWEKAKSDVANKPAAAEDVEKLKKIVSSIKIRLEKISEIQRENGIQTIK